MKMKIQRNIQYLGMFCFMTFFSFSLVMQVRSKPEMYVPVTIESLEAANVELNSLKSENASLLDLKNLKKAQLDKMLKQMETEDVTSLSEEYKKEINEKKMELGLLAVEGPGVVIKLTDNAVKRPIGYDVNEDVIHDLDLLILLNELNVAGAEAISINDERLMAKSSVICGGPILRINDQVVAMPLYIKAIGNPDQLYAAMTGAYSYGEYLKSYGLGVDTTVSDHITVKGYNSEFSFQYASPVKEEENP